jgi:hypothetical protein
VAHYLRRTHDAPQLKQPEDMNKNIYPDNADSHEEIREAEERASAGHKRLLLVFGANWCFRLSRARPRVSAA